MVLSVIVTILAFGVMVILHELGHFTAAKKFGVTVHEFSIGMGPRLVKWGKGETEYSLRLLPLGGYVKLEGEDDESDNPRAFSNIHPIKRIVILVMGALMNIVLGFLCFVIINNVSGSVYTNTVGAFTENSRIEAAGVKVGDEIVKLDKTRVDTYSDIKLFMLDAPEKVNVEYIRDGQRYKTTVEPMAVSGGVLLGFTPQIKSLNFFETLSQSYYDTRYAVRAVVTSLKMLFTGEANVSDMSGPVGIVSVVDDTAQQTKEYGLTVMAMTLLNLFAMISINLGVLNLFPFPALDGGSIIFAFIELVTRKKIKQEVLGYINLIGLVLILGLGLFVMCSDIIKLF